MTDTDCHASYISRSTLIAGTGIDWAAVPRHPLPAPAARTLQYMQDIESHTIVYLRELLATRVIDDSGVADFLACWFYEESAHGRALRRFLSAAGHAPLRRRRARLPLRTRLEAAGIAALSRLWRHFVAVHMTWGAINELTTLTAYRRLARRAGHPVLDALVAAIARDESRHFGVYFAEAERRLAASPGVRRVTRRLVERFWSPVGSGVQPAAETRALGAYLFGGADGRAAARTIDRTIRRLPGFAGIDLVEAWLDRHVGGAEGSAAADHDLGRERVAA